MKATRFRKPKSSAEVIKHFTEDMKQVLHEEVPVERTAGATVSGNKVPWTPRDLRQFKQVTFTPQETAADFQWNGLSFNFIQDVEVTVPEPVATAYRLWIERSRGRFRRKVTNSGESTVPMMVGGLEPEVFETISAGV